MNATEALLAGADILSPIMCAAGFQFSLDASGPSSGGQYACGHYAKGDRRLDLHFRNSLGLVTYWIGIRSLGHESYMRGLGVDGRNQYPGFSGDPLDGFRHLGRDLEDFCSDFLTGPGRVFLSIARSSPKTVEPPQGYGAFIDREKRYR